MDNEVKYLYLDDIIPNRFQPRENFDEQALKELAVSIREHGVIQPIVVRQIGEKYEIIAGERRYKASTMAGLTKIPAIIRNLDDKESSKVALIENLQRRDLTAIEEARTYQKILELDALTQEELARTMGKSQSAVSNKLRLLSLTEEVQDALLNEQISERHARSLLNVSEPDKQVELLNKVITSRMTVRELDQEIKNLNTTSTTSGISENVNSGIQHQSSSDDIISVEEQNPVFINPTVVDVEKLRNQSVDISIPQKPEPNLDTLMTPIQNNVIENNLETENNKFISNVDISKENNNDNNIIGGSGLLAGMTLEDSIKPSVPITPEVQTNSNIGLENNLYKNFESIPTQNNIPDISIPSVPNVGSSPSVDVTTTVNKIKEVINTVKSSGNKIDVEEFDFDDFYQFVIRIDKQ